MADQIHSLDELEELIYDLTVSMLGEDEESTNVRRSWPTEGAPAFDKDDNVVFYRIYDVPSPLTGQRESTYSQKGSPEVPNMATSYTRTFQVSWICYGSNSWAYANLIRNGLFYQENRDVLSREHIFVVPDMTPPKRVPEQFSGLWYERCDLEVRFNEHVVVNRMVPYLETARIVVEDYSGVVATIDVEE